MTFPPKETERRALALVEAALSETPSERRQYILQQPEDQTVIRRALEIFGAQKDDTPAVRTGGGASFFEDGARPDFVGGYGIVRELGRGGMGAVFLGRRDNADFDHFAAIKIVPAELATTRFLDRLRGERRTLARLKHPNIAQFYDGGELDDGAPYFIMEYVDGKPLDIFLRETVPDLSGRLEIFRDVCAAVAFAHQNLIIHRDLAPANILITMDGGVKLIDFGIAQALDADDDPAPRTTATKGYAAPERLEGGPASTITDVFSLGVILEEMVEGLTPPRANDLTAIIERARHIDPRARYQSVDAIAADIDAYRNNRPVSARNGGWRYELTRFIDRHRYAAATGIAAMIAMLCASIAMTALYIRADTAEAHANQRFEDVRSLASFLIFEHFDAIADMPDGTPAREQLAETALEYLDALGETPDASKQLRIEIAEGYKRLADVTGMPSERNLGARRDAGALLDKAAAMIGALESSFPQDENVLRSYVTIMKAWGIFQHFERNDFEVSIDVYESARNAAIRLRESGKAGITDALDDAHIDFLMAYVREQQGQYDRAAAEMAAAMLKYETLNASSQSPAVRYGYARANIFLGEALSWQAYANGTGYELAVAHLDKGVGITRELVLADPANLEARFHLVVALLKRANTICYLPGREAAGLRDINEGVEQAERLLERDRYSVRAREHIILLAAQQSDCLIAVGDVVGAAAAADLTVGLFERRLADSPQSLGLMRGLANAQGIQVSAYRAAGKWEDACRLVPANKDTWRRYRELLSPAAGLPDMAARDVEGLEQIGQECAARNL